MMLIVKLFASTLTTLILFGHLLLSSSKVKVNMSRVALLKRLPKQIKRQIFTTNLCIFKRNGWRYYSTPAESLSVVYSHYGDPNKVLQFQRSPIPSLGNNDILIKMLMAPVNPSDINMIEGTYFLKPELPAVVGNEGVGEVIEVGQDVKTLKPGDWVIPGDAGFGTWRTYAVGDSGFFRKVPNDIPALGAATIAVNPCTAYRMLKDFVSLKPGDLVIQNSANSAVGQSVIQITKAWNIDTINIVRKRDDIDALVKELKDLGGTHVLTEDFVASAGMKEFMKTLKKPPLLAFNGVGGKSATELLRNLGRKGVMVTYGGMSRKPVTVPTGVFIFKEVTAIGYWNSQWNKDNKDNPEKDKMFSDICDLIKQGKLSPPASDLIPFENYAEAVKTSMAGFQGKKKVLKIS